MYLNVIIAAISAVCQIKNPNLSHEAKVICIDKIVNCVINSNEYTDNEKLSRSIDKCSKEKSKLNYE